MYVISYYSVVSFEYYVKTNIIDQFIGEGVYPEADQDSDGISRNTTPSEFY